MAEKLFSRDAARGMLVGLAVGDAVGTTVEFSPRGSFAPVTDVVGGGPFGLRAGEWTDDTSMALCLADSLLETGGWNAADCMQRFVDWRDHGVNSVTGRCFDIGNQTSAALNRFLASDDPYAGPTDEAQSGNGGVMRLTPAVIAFGDDLAGAEAAAMAQSRVTHASPTCLSHARDMARMLVEGRGWPDAAAPEVASGYVMHSMQAAWWALGTTDDFHSAVLAVVNLGGDADTVGAIVGQLAGRVYGYDAIPPDWRERLAWHDAILARADALWDMRASWIG